MKYERVPIEVFVHMRYLHQGIGWKQETSLKSMLKRMKMIAKKKAERLKY